MCSLEDESILGFEKPNLHYSAIIITLFENGLKTTFSFSTIMTVAVYHPEKYVIMSSLAKTVLMLHTGKCNTDKAARLSQSSEVFVQRFKPREEITDVDTCEH